MDSTMKSQWLRDLIVYRKGANWSVCCIESSPECPPIDTRTRYYDVLFRKQNDALAFAHEVAQGTNWLVLGVVDDFLSNVK